MTDNPFETLRLSPEATPEQAVKQAARLAQLAPDEAARNRIRQAIQTLISSSEAWTLAALLTHPRPEYHSPEVEQFVAQHRRLPRVPSEAVVPGVDEDELRNVLMEVLAEQMQVDPLPFERVEIVESADEIDQETAEAVWRGIVAQLGG